MTECSVPACRRQGKVDIKARITDEVKPGILSSTFHFPEMMLNLIASSVSDPLVPPLRRDRSCPEFKVVCCGVRKARRTHLREAGRSRYKQNAAILKCWLVLTIGLFSNGSMRAQSDPAPPMPVGFYPTYAFNGTMIDGAGLYHHVQMELVCLLDSTLVGSYHTWHENDGLSLAGRLKSDSSFTLNERDEHGRFTGVFRGRVQGTFERLLGTWTSVGNWDRTMSVDLGRRHEAYAEYLSKWRSYPEYRDLGKALNSTHVVRQLNLSRHGMIGVDDLEGVDRLQNLLSLDLLANGFDTLPRVVCALTNLEDLSLSSNDHIHIPPCIAQLKHLRMLILTFSSLAELPPYLAELGSLLYLDASHNDLTTVPQEFVALKQLQVLDLSDNRIGQREQERIRAMLPWCWVKF